LFRIAEQLTVVSVPAYADQMAPTSGSSHEGQVLRALRRE